MPDPFLIWAIITSGTSIWFLFAWQDTARERELLEIKAKDLPPSAPRPSKLPPAPKYGTDQIKIPLHRAPWYGEFFKPVFQYLEDAGHIPDKNRVTSCTVHLTAGHCVIVENLNANGLCDWCDKLHDHVEAVYLPTGDVICAECEDTHEVVHEDGGPRVVQVKPHSLLGDPQEEDDD